MKIFSVNYDLLIQAKNAEQAQEVILKRLGKKATITEVEIPTLEEYIEKMKEGHYGERGKESEKRSSFPFRIK